MVLNRIDASAHSLKQAIRDAKAAGLDSHNLQWHLSNVTAQPCLVEQRILEIVDENQLRNHLGEVL